LKKSTKGGKAATRASRSSAATWTDDVDRSGPGGCQRPVVQPDPSMNHRGLYPGGGRLDRGLHGRNHPLHLLRRGIQVQGLRHPMLGGIFIAALASFLGIGGGFLFVPFLTSVAGLPMFLVAGTSALCVLVGMIVSMFQLHGGQGRHHRMGFGCRRAGGHLRRLHDRSAHLQVHPRQGLKWIFIVLAFYVGIRYMSKGFFGTSWVPPF
jgi:hypothetical protein